MKYPSFCCAALLLAVFSANAQTAPTAKQICDEARANILRARLTYLDKPVQDTLHIARIFSSRERFNEYHVELRSADEWQKKYPDMWAQSYYAMADEKLLKTPLMQHSVGDAITVHATVSGIELVEPASESPWQHPNCKLALRVDWERAKK